MQNRLACPQSNEEWRAWGKLDPLFGVAPAPEHGKRGPAPWTDEAFYALGEVDWRMFRSQWRQYGLRWTTCLEIGCGAGRLTTQMAADFDSVHAIDVSANMIDYARARVPSNVSFYVTDGLEIPLPDSSIDGVFSTHVLQHLSSTDALTEYFREIYRALSPGGSMMIHIPVIAWPGGSFLQAHRLIHKVKGILSSCHARLRRFAFRSSLIREPHMQVIWYETDWLVETLRSFGFQDIEFRILFGPSKMASQHPFVFARKDHIHF